MDSTGKRPKHADMCLSLFALGRRNVRPRGWGKTSGPDGSFLFCQSSGIHSQELPYKMAASCVCKQLQNSSKASHNYPMYPVSLQESVPCDLLKDACQLHGFCSDSFFLLRAAADLDAATPASHQHWISEWRGSFHTLVSSDSLWTFGAFCMAISASFNRHQPFSEIKCYSFSSNGAH